VEWEATTYPRREFYLALIEAAKRPQVMPEGCVRVACACLNRWFVAPCVVDSRCFVCHTRLRRAE
jgi:hypothetical protein